jgi:hypothetical protein
MFVKIDDDCLYCGQDEVKELFFCKLFLKFGGHHNLALLPK